MTTQSIHNFTDVGIDPTRKKEIAMPPLPNEKQQEAKQPEYEVHPEIAKEFPPGQQMQMQEEEPVIEQKEVVPEPEPEIIKEQPLETQNSKNIRFLREKAQRAEQAERERDLLLQKLAQIETTKQNTQSNFTNQPETEISLDPEDFVNAKHLNKYDKKIAILQEELQQYKQQSNLTTVDAQVRARYPDFEKIVSKDNIDMLKQEYPEIAATINANPDLYSKAVAAYTMIKKLDINTEDIYLDDKIKIQRNQAKPKPSNSIAPTKGDSPLSKANGFATGLTDDVRKALWKEMQEAKRNI